MEVSIAPGSDEEGEGLSIILTPAGLPDDREDMWHFGYVLHPQENETYPQMIERIAVVLGIKPEEQVWQDGEDLA